MRAHPIFCDWCGANITKAVIIYGNSPLGPHAAYDGARYSWDFCSDEHLLAWKDEAAMRRMTQARTHRLGGPDEQAAVAYRQQLSEEIETRIAEVLAGPQRGGG